MPNSRVIASAQQDVHEHLYELIEKHKKHYYQKPISDYNQQAFVNSIAPWLQTGKLPLILDSGCGVGLSSRHLAKQYPDHFVIGIDQSADRLARNTHWEGNLPDNLIFVRADLVDYWRLLYNARLYPTRHYLLYPNPWPKIGHLSRRWHGHPVFPYIVALGGYIECRSNWLVYVKEFASGLKQLSRVRTNVGRYAPKSFITPFEKKYVLSGQDLWRCSVTLPQSKLFIYR